MAQLDASERPARRKRTYFDVMANRIYFSALILAALFYLVALLGRKGRMSVETGVVVLAFYWGVSLAYFAFGMCRDFPRFYRFFVGRMRHYEPFAWITIFDVIGILLWGVGPVVYFLALGFNTEISSDIKSFSIRSLISTYGCSLICSMTVMSMIVNCVATKRGVRCFKPSTWW